MHIAYIPSKTSKTYKRLFKLKNALFLNNTKLLLLVKVD